MLSYLWLVDYYTDEFGGVRLENSLGITLKRIFLDLYWFSILILVVLMIPRQFITVIHPILVVTLRPTHWQLYIPELWMSSCSLSQHHALSHFLLRSISILTFHEGRIILSTTFLLSYITSFKTFRLWSFSLLQPVLAQIYTCWTNQANKNANVCKELLNLSLKGPEGVKDTVDHQKPSFNGTQFK